MLVVSLLHSSGAQSPPAASQPIAAQPPQPLNSPQASADQDSNSSHHLTEICKPYKNNIADFYTAERKKLMENLSRFVFTHNWAKYEPLSLLTPPLTYFDKGHKYIFISPTVHSLASAKTYCKDTGKSKLMEITTLQDWELAKELAKDVPAKGIIGLKEFWTPIKECNANNKMATYQTGKKVPIVTSTDLNTSLNPVFDCANNHQKYFIQSTGTNATPPKIKGLPNSSQKKMKAICEIEKTMELMTFQRISKSRTQFKGDIDTANPGISKGTPISDLVLSLTETPNCIDDPNAEKLMETLGLVEWFDYLKDQPKLTATGLAPVYDQAKEGFAKLAKIRHAETIENSLETYFKSPIGVSTTGDTICECDISELSLAETIDAMQNDIQDLKKISAPAESNQLQQQVTPAVPIPTQATPPTQGTMGDDRVESSIIEKTNPMIGDPDFESTSNEYHTLTEKDIEEVQDLIQSSSTKLITALPETDAFKTQVGFLINKAMLEHLTNSHEQNSLRDQIENEVKKYGRLNHIVPRLETLEHKLAINNIHSIVQNYLADHSQIKALNFAKDQFYLHQRQDPTETQIRRFAQEEIIRYVHDSDFERILSTAIQDQPPALTHVTLDSDQKLNIVTELMSDQRFIDIIKPNQENNDIITSNKAPEKVATDVEESSTVGNVASKEPPKNAEKISKSPEDTLTTEKSTENESDIESIKDELLNFLQKVLPENVYELVTLILSVSVTALGVLRCYNPMKNKCNECRRNSEMSDDVTNNISLLAQKIVAQRSYPGSPVAERNITFEGTLYHAPSSNSVDQYFPDLTARN